MWLLLIIIKMFVHLYFWKKFPLFRFSVHAVLTRTPPPLFSHWPATELARSRNRSQGHDVGHCSFFSQRVALLHWAWVKLCFPSLLSILAAERGSLRLWHDLMLHLSRSWSVHVNVQVSYNNSAYIKAQIEISCRATICFLYHFLHLKHLSYYHDNLRERSRWFDGPPVHSALFVKAYICIINLMKHHCVVFFFFKVVWGRCSSVT